MNSQCEGATDEEACLAEQAGEPTLRIQPGPLFDYRVTWLSGLVGVIVTFAAEAGLVRPPVRPTGQDSRPDRARRRLGDAATRRLARVRRRCGDPRRAGRHGPAAPPFVLRHMTIEVPFLLAAAVLPFSAENGVVLGATVGIKVTVGVLGMAS